MFKRDIVSNLAPGAQQLMGITHAGVHHDGQPSRFGATGGLLVALALPVFRMDRLASVRPILSDSSVSVMRRA